MKTLITILLGSILLIGLTDCATSGRSGTSQKESSQKDYSNYANMADVMRSIPGIIVRGTGQNIEIQVRAQNSMLLSSEPLFIVNNVQVGRSFSLISHLNPVDIVSIQVQKGLYAVNRYGSEGNSGVIKILTKSEAQVNNKK